MKAVSSNMTDTKLIAAIGVVLERSSYGKVDPKKKYPRFFPKTNKGICRVRPVKKKTILVL